MIFSIDEINFEILVVINGCSSLRGILVSLNSSCVSKYFEGIFSTVIHVLLYMHLFNFKIKS